MWSGTASTWTFSEGGGFLAQAGRIAQIGRLIRSGHRSEAIRLYQEAFKVSPEEAASAVQRLESGQAVSLISAHIADQVRNAPISVDLTGARRALKPILIVIVVVTVASVIIAIVAIAGGLTAALSGFNRTSPVVATPTPTAFPTIPPGLTGIKPSRKEFAKPVLEIGSQGIGAGQFVDSRSVTVDPSGNFYVGEYQGGRVQVFDPQGRFVTQWIADKDRVLMNLAADRQGNVYVVQPGRITRHKGSTGEINGELALPRGGIKWSTGIDAVVMLDGTVVVLDSHSNIAWVDPEGRVKNLVSASDKVGERVNLRHLAVDGSGNIYAIDDVKDCVFKFASDGRYVNRFGGRVDQFNPRSNEPGQLNSPHGIAVDGKGRVYVSDSGILVFDSSGRYIDTIGKGVVFGMAISDGNEIFATHRNDYKIIKYALPEN